MVEKMKGLILLLLISYNLQWKPGVGGAPPTGYRIYISDKAGDYSAAQVIDAGLPTAASDGWMSYRFTNWDIDTPKYMVVRAYTSIAESGNSPELYVGKPQVPQSLRVEK